MKCCQRHRLVCWLLLLICWYVGGWLYDCLLFSAYSLFSSSPFFPVLYLFVACSPLFSSFSLLFFFFLLFLLFHFLFVRTATPSTRSILQLLYLFYLSTVARSPGCSHKIVGFARGFVVFLFLFFLFFFLESSSLSAFQTSCSSATTAFFL